MILSVINGILDRLREYGVARHYGFAEIIPDGDALIPSIYCSNGDYRHVVDGYEWSEGIAYIRMSGKDSSEQIDEDSFMGCQDLVSIRQPLMLVVIGKRKGYRNFEMGELIRAKVTGLYPALAQAVGAVFVDVDVRGIDYDIATVLSSEFEGASISWDTGNYIIAVDMDVVVRIDTKCLSNADPCPPPTPPTPPPPPPPPYQPGDFVQGGLYTFTDGVYAYITAESDQSTNAPWGCPATPMVGLSGQAGAGAANTAIIVASCTEAGIAARIADDLVLNGFSDWFLPSVGELNEMRVRLHLAGFGNFSNGSYWSSFDETTSKAYSQNFNSGAVSSHNKFQTNRYTRAMRRFLLP